LNELSKKSCEACEVGAPLVPESDFPDLLTQVEGWQIHRDEINKLIKQFMFDDYIAAVHFTNAVANLAEQEDHHPSINLEWGKVTVQWWSHKIKGLHMNDFICAAKTNKLIKN
tara:strand:- start:102 stop:440 length:339 start_codon:yes stop_codon:yes gene_type:complete